MSGALRAAIEAEITHAIFNAHYLDRDCQGVGPGERVPAVRVDALRAALAAPSTEPALDGIAAIKSAHPAARLGMNENDLGVFEVWAKEDRASLGFASGPSLDEAFAALAARLAESQP